MKPDIYSDLPLYALESLDRYLEHGIFPGSAIWAVLTNDLMGLLKHTDGEAWREGRHLCRYVYNRVPSCAWGSWEVCEEWSQAGDEFRGKILAANPSHRDYISTRRLDEEMDRRVSRIENKGKEA